MTAIVNILCLMFGFFITWKFVRDHLGIKQLGVYCIAIGLNFSFVYFCAKYFDIGFVLLPSQSILSSSEAAMGMSLAIVKALVFIFPVCYIFEWWYYRKHPDIDPYTGKKKESADDK